MPDTQPRQAAGSPGGGGGRWLATPSRGRPEAPAVVEPPRDEDTLTLECGGARLRFRFSYNAALVSAVKSLGATFLPDSKTWALHANGKNLAAAVGLAEEWEVWASPEVTAAAARRGGDSVEADLSYDQRAGRGCAVFGFNRAINELIKSQLGAGWDREDRVWRFKASKRSARRAVALGEAQGWYVHPELRRLAGEDTPDESAPDEAAPDEAAPDEAAPQPAAHPETEGGAPSPPKKAAPAGSGKEAPDAAAYLERLQREHGGFSPQPGFGLELYEYQRLGAGFAAQERRCLIGDEPGLGKTRQALAAAGPDDFPLLVVCPAPLTVKWQREAQAAYPGKTVWALVPPKTKLPADGEAVAADVMIIGYPMLEKARRSGTLPEIKGVVYDEIHYLKNPRAKRSAAARAISKKLDKDALVLGLSGTPIPNSLEELVEPLDILGRLQDDFGGKWRFLRRYTWREEIQAGRRTITRWSGARNAAELRDRLYADLMVRRRKADVLKDLPEKQVNFEPLALDQASQILYDRMEEAVAAGGRGATEAELAERDEDLGGKSWAVALVDGTITVKNAERYATWMDPLAAVGALRQLVGLLKVEAAAEVARSHLEAAPDEPLVIFAHHRGVVEGLRDALADYDAAAVYGGMPPADRQETIDGFQRQGDGAPRVLVCAVEAAAEGLDLYAARRMLIVEQPWNPARCQQAEDRIHRIGQKRGVSIDYLLSAGTFDESVAKIVEAKRSTVTAVLAGSTAERDESRDLRLQVYNLLRTSRGKEPLQAGGQAAAA